MLTLLRASLPEPLAREAQQILSLAEAGRRFEVGPDLARGLLGLLGRVRPFWVPGGFWLCAPEHLAFFNDQGVCQVSSPLPSPPETSFRLSSFTLQRILDERTHLWLWTGGQRQEKQEVGYFSHWVDGGPLHWKSCPPIHNEPYYQLEQLDNGDFVLAGEMRTTRYHEDLHFDGAWVLSPKSGSAVPVEFALRPRGVARDFPQPELSHPQPITLGPDRQLTWGSGSLQMPTEYPTNPNFYKLHKYLSAAWRDGGRSLTVDVFSCTHLLVRYFPE